MNRPIRISRRLALAGGAAAALIAGNSFAQAVPAPGEPMAFPAEEDVLFEHGIVDGPFGFALPAPHKIAFGPLGPVSIEGLEQQLAQTKADRDFAQGKTDLAAVNVLIQSAETLIGQAKAKQPAQPAPVVESPGPGMLIRKLGPFAVSREARQASAQLRAAGAQLEAALPGVLPSQGQRVSRELSVAHKLISQAAAARNNADAANLATQAQGFYKQAYDAYQAGQYDKAGAHARAALATAEAARAAVEPEPVKPSAPPAPPPPPTF